MEAKLWEGAEQFREGIQEGDFVKFQGVAQKYNDVNQLILNRIRKATSADVNDGFDINQLVPCTEHDIDELWDRLRALVSENLERSCLLELLSNLLGEHEEKLRSHPAGVEIHHSYRGGLLEHIVSVLESALFFAEKYPNVDRDLLIAGAVLHDIGKLEELSNEGHPAYTLEGQLIGHIVLGFEMVRRQAALIPEFPEDLLVRLQHMILSHQGQPEWGSPQTPKMLEALILHYIDDLDAKLNRFYRLLKEDMSDSQFTPYDRHLGRAILKGEAADRGEAPLVASG